MEERLKMFFGGAHSRRTHSQFFVDSLIKLGRNLRAQRDPAEHEALKNAPQVGLQHRAVGMIGNLARLAYREDSDAIWATDWIGPSVRVMVQASANAAANGSGLVVRPSENNASLVVESQPQIIFKPALGSAKRRHDSEFLLLNLLHHCSMNGSPLKGGELVLVTELIPCKQCELVIRQFCNLHRDVDVSVAFMFETKDRPPSALLSTGLPPNLAVYKLAMHGTGASAVQITTSTPVHLLSSEALEKGEAYDFSSHVLGHAVAVAQVDFFSKIGGVRR